MYKARVLAEHHQGNDRVPVITPGKNWDTTILPEFPSQGIPPLPGAQIES